MFPCDDVYMHVYLCMYLPLCIHVFVRVMHWNVCDFMSVSLCICVCLSLPLSVHVSVCLSLCGCTSDYVHVCEYVRMSVDL